MATEGHTSRSSKIESMQLTAKDCRAQGALPQLKSGDSVEIAAKGNRAQGTLLQKDER
jgi:hypothetical protein